MVIFLTGLVSMILMRTLRNDYAKYAREDDDLETLVTPSPISYLFSCYILAGLYSCIYWVARRVCLLAYNAQERDVNEESGWKLVHGDVFRPPQNLALLSAVVGTGAQLATLVLLVIILAIVGMLYIGYVIMSCTSNSTFCVKLFPIHSCFPLLFGFLIPSLFTFS